MSTKDAPATPDDAHRRRRVTTEDLLDAVPDRANAAAMEDPTAAANPELAALAQELSAKVAEVLDVVRRIRDIDPEFFSRRPEPPAAT